MLGVGSRVGHVHLRGLLFCTSSSRVGSARLASIALGRCRSCSGSARLAPAAPQGAMAGVTVESVPCLSDNYAWIIHDPASEVTAVVDPSEAAPINKYLSERNLRLTHIINTHHH